MNADTSPVMRVIIKNFNMTASEMARVWAQQEKVRKKWSQREQKLTIEVIRKKQEVHEMKDLIAELKASLARSPDELRQTLKKVITTINLSRMMKERSYLQYDKGDEI